MRPSLTSAWSLTTIASDGWWTAIAVDSLMARFSSASVAATAMSVMTVLRGCGWSSSGTCACANLLRKSVRALRTCAMVTPSPFHASGFEFMGSPSVNSRPVPFPTVRLEQPGRRRRSPRAGRVRLQRRPPIPPGGLDWIDQGPCGLHLVGAGEQRRVADHAVEQESFVGLRRFDEERGRIQEIHRDAAQADAGGRHLRPELERDAFLGLYPKSDGVGVELLGGLAPECQVRRAVELDANLRRALGHALAGADVERDPRPPPVVDEESHRHEGLGQRALRDVGLFAVTVHVLAEHVSTRVLAAHGRFRHLIVGERP